MEKINYLETSIYMIEERLYYLIYSFDRSIKDNSIENTGKETSIQFIKIQVFNKYAQSH